MGQDEVFVVLKQYPWKLFSTKAMAIKLDCKRGIATKYLRTLWKSRRDHNFNDIERLIVPGEGRANLMVEYRYIGNANYIDD